jgi:hypothetical protein
MKVFGWLILIVIVIAAVQLNERSTDARNAATQARALAQATKDKTFLAFMKVNVTDTSVTPTRSFVVSGDQRPIWRVSGRVLNDTQDHDVRTAVVRFYFGNINGDVQYDTSNVTLHDIDRGETRAFQEEVHILPPKAGKWTYKADVMEVEFTDGTRFPPH